MVGMSGTGRRGDGSRLVLALGAGEGKGWLLLGVGLAMSGWNVLE